MSHISRTALQTAASANMSLSRRSAWLASRPRSLAPTLNSARPQEAASDSAYNVLPVPLWPTFEGNQPYSAECQQRAKTYHETIEEGYHLCLKSYRQAFLVSFDPSDACGCSQAYEYPSSGHCQSSRAGRGQRYYLHHRRQRWAWVIFDRVRTGTSVFGSMRSRRHAATAKDRRLSVGTPSRFAWPLQNLRVLP